MDHVAEQQAPTRSDMDRAAEQQEPTRSDEDQGKEQQTPFRFYTELRLVQLTGRKARTMRQLLGHLKKVPGSSIFYHTHQRLLEHHFEKPTGHNDFALWVADALQEDALGEKLAFIDLRDYSSVRDLRSAIIGIIENQVARDAKIRSRHCPPGEEFHFCRSKSFVMSTGQVAQSVEEFFRLLPSISKPSLYFHFIESRLRLDLKTNDFSNWLDGRGEPALARAINALNPYVRTLDELKAEMAALGGKG
jgi:hypothetical protein